ncbi:hypothetical protein HLV40_16715 [Chromohalobacter salexigens]|nr:hypothetical protein [Chromohalobacter salexigens]
MHDYYAIEFGEIAEEYFTGHGMQLIGLGDKDSFSKVDAIAKYDMLSAISTAYSLFEQKCHELLDHDESSKPVMIWHDQRFYSLLKLLDPSVIDNKRPREFFDSIRQLRNVSVHRQHHNPDEYDKELVAGLQKIKNLYYALSEIPQEEVFKLARRG